MVTLLQPDLCAGERIVEDARRLLRVCLENRRLLRQNQPATAPEKRRELNKGESLRVITPSVSGRILVS